MTSPTRGGGNSPRKPGHKTTRVVHPSGTTIKDSETDKYVDVNDLSYATIAIQSPSENSDVVRRGIGAAFVRRLARDLEIDQSTLTAHMGIARSTFSRKLKNDESLSHGDGAIALGVARMIGEVDRMLRESGDPEQMGASFDVAEWTGRWLEQPVGALGNRRPLDYLDNAFGQETVLQIIRQMQSGAFA
jgi:putative toxin-antitoxin system antitoxin component (TIGR02293 family)